MSLPSYLPESLRNMSELHFNHAEDKQQLLDLLNYYRHKIDVQEKERIEWLAEIEQMRQNVENVHFQEQEIFQKKLQIAEI